MRQTPASYAKKLYTADRCNGTVATYSDNNIANYRINAFIDGVKWARRQARKRKTMKDAWQTRRKKYGPSGQRPIGFVNRKTTQ